jgi:hypothetical protein
MTNRHKLNLGMGMAFLAFGIIVLVSLRLLEGIVVQNGQQYIYSVDPNVYLILLLIAFVGLTIVLLTVVESRQQRGSEAEGKDGEVLRNDPNGTAEPLLDAGKVPAMAAETQPLQRIIPKPIPRTERPKGAVSVPLKVEAIGCCPMCGKVILMEQSECVKCGWKVVQNKAVPLPELGSDPDF